MEKGPKKKRKKLSDVLGTYKTSPHPGHFAVWPHLSVHGKLVWEDLCAKTYFLKSTETHRFDLNKAAADLGVRRRTYKKALEDLSGFGLLIDWGDLSGKDPRRRVVQCDLGPVLVWKDQDTSAHSRSSSIEEHGPIPEVSEPKPEVTWSHSRSTCAHSRSTCAHSRSNQPENSEIPESSPEDPGSAEDPKDLYRIFTGSIQGSLSLKELETNSEQPNDDLADPEGPRIEVSKEEVKSTVGLESLAHESKPKNTVPSKSRVRAPKKGVTVPRESPPKEVIEERMLAAAESCRSMARLTEAEDPKTEAAWWGRLGFDDLLDDALDLYLLLQQRGVSPRHYFLMAPYYMTRDQLYSFRCLADPSLIDLVSDVLTRMEHQDDSVMSLVVTLDDAIKAIPPAGGSNQRKVTIREVGRVSEALAREVQSQLDKFGTAQVYFQAKYESWVGWAEKKRAEGDMVPNPSLWSLVKAKAPEVTPRRQDRWTEIRVFLGIPDAVKIETDFICAGFNLSPAHESQAMMTTKRGAPGHGHKGTWEDVDVINDRSYMTKRSQFFHAYTHYKDAHPGSSLYLKVTPETFHEFKDTWFDNLESKVPPLDMYKKYGLFAHELDSENRLFGKVVKWPKRK